MSDGFESIVQVETPGRGELRLFVDEVETFLSFMLYDDRFESRFWGTRQELRFAAQQSFDNDVLPAIRALRESIESISEEALLAHGLMGSAAFFKYMSLRWLFQKWASGKASPTVGMAFRRFGQGLDVVLGSLAEAVGFGGLVEEFKDMLLAIAPGRALPSRK